MSFIEPELSKNMLIFVFSSITIAGGQSPPQFVPPALIVNAAKSEYGTPIATLFCWIHSLITLVPIVVYSRYSSVPSHSLNLIHPGSVTFNVTPDTQHIGVIVGVGVGVGVGVDVKYSVNDASNVQSIVGVGVGVGVAVSVGVGVGVEVGVAVGVGVLVGCNTTTSIFSLV